MTRIPQLEQELIAAAARLQSRRRLVWPVARVALAAAAVAVVAVLSVVVVADNDGDRRSQPAGATPSVPNPDLVDREAGVRFTSTAGCSRSACLRPLQARPGVG